MEYYTSESQERELNERYMAKVRDRQDQIRFSLHKNREVLSIPEPDRIFIIEDGKVYLEQVDKKTECPQGYVMGGRSYCIDYMFAGDIQRFMGKHKKYMIIFSVSGRFGLSKKYCGGYGVYPARIVGDFEELILEDEEKYISQTL
jgi:hypothetical protein